MILAVASGKGGTGKTRVAASFALSMAAEQSPPPLLLDYDVEAPNAHHEPAIQLCLLLRLRDR